MFLDWTFSGTYDYLKILEVNDQGLLFMHALIEINASNIVLDLFFPWANVCSSDAPGFYASFCLSCNNFSISERAYPFNSINYLYFCTNDCCMLI